MFSLLLLIIRWIARRLLWLFVITAVLWAGWYIKDQLATLESQEASVRYLEQETPSLVAAVMEQAASAERSGREFKEASVDQLNARIRELSQQIDAKLITLQELDSIIHRLNPAKHLDAAKLKAEIEIARQERAYLNQLKGIHDRASTTAQIARRCEEIRRQHVAVFALYQGVEDSLKKLKVQAGLIALWTPASNAYKQRQHLERERADYARQTRTLKQEYGQCLAEHRTSQQAYLQAKGIGDFVLERSKTDAVIRAFSTEVATMREEVDTHWIQKKLIEPVKKILPAALQILALVIAIPIIMKLVLFYMLAPIAARGRAIRLLPGTITHAHIPEQPPSAVSVAVHLSADTQLLVKPAYFHSAPQYCTTVSKIGLNPRFLFTSFAAGMHTLTQVRCDGPASVTLSAGHDTLNELSILRIAPGEAVSIRPKNLVGIVHPRLQPVGLSSHWRLGSLQAWLSLQLRYLVLHGPADILIKGCRGVRIEEVAQERMIDQGATIGFSAHLDYGVSRTETFLAYFTGEKGLLRDRFSGANGFYIYEEMPEGGKASRTKRGIEGVTDSILKVFGI